jgi:hypothetical protein
VLALDVIVCGPKRILLAGLQGHAYLVSIEVMVGYPSTETSRMKNNEAAIETTM